MSAFAAGQEICTLKGHNAEVIAVRFGKHGNELITASFDGSVAIWDIRSNK